MRIAIFTTLYLAIIVGGLSSALLAQDSIPKGLKPRGGTALKGGFGVASLDPPEKALPTEASINAGNLGSIKANVTAILSVGDTGHLKIYANRDLHLRVFDYQCR